MFSLKLGITKSLIVIELGFRSKIKVRNILSGLTICQLFCVQVTALFQLKI